jgi:hypothetical protein
MLIITYVHLSWYVKSYQTDKCNSSTLNCTWKVLDKILHRSLTILKFLNVFLSLYLWKCWEKVLNNLKTTSFKILTVSLSMIMYSFHLTLYNICSWISLWITHCCHPLLCFVHKGMSKIQSFVSLSGCKTTLLRFFFPFNFQYLHCQDTSLKLCFRNDINTHSIKYFFGYVVIRNLKIFECHMVTHWNWLQKNYCCMP